jgi:arylsulfatase A-like enzyme
MPADFSLLAGADHPAACNRNPVSSSFPPGGKPLTKEERERGRLRVARGASAVPVLCLVLTLAAGSLGAGEPSAPRAAKPNVILIMTDDQGHGDFSLHGNPVLKTPALDALAHRSIRFTDFHVAPTCTPTRGQLLTGLDALRNGATSATGQRLLLKRGLPTMGDIFRANGYRTALYGKWHLGGNFVDFRPHERGFEDAVYFLRGGVQSHPNPWNSDLFDDTLYHNGELKQFPGYATDVWFDLATEFVRKRRQDGQPFFLYLPLNAPHAPYMVPEAYREPYKNLEKLIATFFGMIATVDDRVGRFVAMLEEEGMADNTLLIFLTDNGTAEGDVIYNSGMRGRKTSLYEGGHRVPCWISWPKGSLVEPRDIDVLTQCQDLLPTLIDLCGLEVPAGTRFDGTSLAPLLRGGRQPELDDRMLVVQRITSRGRGTVMWRKWRLVEEELYDLRSDPGQSRNVAAENPAIVQRLQSHYDRWWQSVEPGLAVERYRLGVAGNETMLTAYDWEGRTVANWPHLRRGDRGQGRYAVTIDQPGRYRISLRRWPRESGAGIRAAVPRHVPPDAFMAFDDDHRSPHVPPFPPGQALDIVGAKVRFGNHEQSLPVRSDDQEVTFTFELPAGDTDFQTWFRLGDGTEFGAYYAYIRRE